MAMLSHHFRRAVVTASSYCQRSFSLSRSYVAPSSAFPSASALFCRSVVRHPNKFGQDPTRFFSTQRKLMPTEKRNFGDHKRRLLAANFELRRKLHKALCKDPDLPSDVREKHRYKLSKLPRNSSFVRVKNRCILTGRSRSVSKLFRISRIVFRGLAARGALMGIKKSSW